MRFPKGRSFHNELRGALLSSDRRPWIAPDIVAELSFRDEANNRDPAFAAVPEAIRSSGNPAH